jgi:hypothetical protein
LAVVAVPSQHSTNTVPAAKPVFLIAALLRFATANAVAARSTETVQHQAADEKSVAIVTVNNPVPVSVMLVTLNDVDSVGVPAATVTKAQNLV